MVVYKEKIAFVIIALVVATVSHAGITDTVHAIKPVQVQGSRLKDYHLGASVYEINSQTLDMFPAESISKLLTGQSLATVSNYGPGGVANVSLRGGGSHHASVIWNGINIQSPLNGGVNFATIPVSFVDRADIQYGGSSTLYGSGTTTGSIHLQDVLNLNSGLSVKVSGFLGSAHNVVQAGKVQYGGKRWASSLKYFVQDNENDFPFRNIEKYGDPMDTLKHGAYQQYGISQANRVRLGNRSWITSSVWLLQHNKKIPALMSDYSTNESANNENQILYSVQYHYQGDRYKVKAQSGGFHNQSLYYDPDTVLQSESRSFTYQNALEGTMFLSEDLSISTIVEHKIDIANSESYGGVYRRNTLSGIGSITYKQQYFASLLNVRSDLVDSKFIPFVFSWGLDVPIFQVLIFKSQISKNYSLPTFNNLYWKPDSYARGNPDLKPESGWSSEAGLYLKLQSNTSNFNFSTVVFRNKITNWIQWLPDITQIWMPMNILTGNSSGIELTANYTQLIGNVKFNFKGRYGYTQAIVEEDRDATLVEGSQMLYIPIHQTGLHASVQYKGIQISYNTSYTSERTYDNSGGILPAYWIGNGVVQYSFKAVKYVQPGLYFKVSNLFNTEYQVQRSYAMPLRQYQVGIKFKFN